MQQHDGVTRREFVVSTTGAAVGALVAGHAGVAAAPQAKRRYAIVGTGDRAIGMWGRPDRAATTPTSSSSSAFATSIRSASRPRRS